MGSRVFVSLVVMAILTHGGRSFFFATVGGIDGGKVGINWISRQYSVDNWKLSANITWPFPADMSIEKEFVIRLSQRDSHCATNSSTDILSEQEKTWCQARVFPFETKPQDIHTENNFTQIEGLEYGTEYIILVAVLDRTENETSVPACKEEKSPDCYSVTGSRRFCQARCIPTPGAPINVNVVRVDRDDSGNGTSAEVTVSWLRPVQHNNEIDSYYVEFVNLNVSQNTHFGYVSENSSYDDTTPFLIKLHNVELNVAYSVSIFVFGYFHGIHRRGEYSSILITVLPEDIETPTTPLQGTTTGDSSTVIVSPKTDALLRTTTTVKAMSAGIIVAATIGGVVLVTAISCSVFCIFKGRQRTRYA